MTRLAPGSRVDRLLPAERTSPLSPPLLAKRARSGWPLTLAMLASLGVAAGGFGGILKEFEWWFVVFAAIAVVLCSAAIARSMSRRPWLPTVVALAAAIVTPTLFFAADASLLGIVPTFDTLDRFEDLVSSGSMSIATQNVPAAPTTGIVFLLTVGFVAVAVLMDIITFVARWPALVGVALLSLLIVPSSIDTALVDPLAFILAAAAYLLFLFLASARNQGGTAFAVGAAAIVGSLVLSAVLPAVTNPGSDPARTGGYATGINPIIDLGADLRRPNPVTALTYTTTSKLPQYFTLSVLDDFSEDTWEAEPEREGGVDLENIGEVPGRSSDLEVTEATTEITVGNVQGRWLPIPYAPRSVTGLVGDWFWSPEDLTIRTLGSNARAQKYTVTSETITPTRGELEAAGNDFPSGFQRYLTLPEDLAPSVAARAVSVVGDAQSNFDKALALQSYFRSSEFTYSEDAPVENGYDGSSAEVIARFLDEKSGYCVHFSSAMAAMARTLDIPSRIGVGFTSGESERNAQTGLTTFTVTTDELHAWPELYFDDLGWVRFEPTKSRGTVPVFPETADDTPDSSSTPTPSRTPSATATRPPRDDTTDGAAGTGLGISPAAIGGSTIVVALLLLLTLPAIVRAARRRRRFTGALRSGSVLDPWQDLLDTARDLGWPVADTETPRQAETRLLDRLTGDSGQPAAEVVDGLDSLRRAVELEVFSGVVPTPASGQGASDQVASDQAASDQVASAHIAEVRLVDSALRRAAGIRRRILARLLPASVLTRSGVPRFGWLAPLVRPRP